MSTWRASDSAISLAEIRPSFRLLVHPGVVLGNLLGLAVADQVAARVAHMRDDGLVVAQRAGHQRGGHLLAAVFRGQGAIVHGGIGMLNQPRQQADQHRSRLRLRKLLGEHGDGCGRGHFAQIHAAHAVGNGKQIAVRSGLLARGGNERSHRVFIVGSNFAGIACLAELYIQHGRRRLKVLPRVARERSSR